MRSRMLSVFAHLGQTVQARWNAAGQDADAFAELATRSVEEIAPAQEVDAPGLLAEIAGTDFRTEQLSSPAFGEPAVTVYSGENFYIEVLYWFASTTAIHDHAFCGAFSVLDGGSLHSQYSFTPSVKCGDGLTLGTLESIRNERLRKGDVRTIHPYDGLIHSLFHIEHPSVSLVVRTQPHIQKGQRNFFPPFVAVETNTTPFANTTVGEAVSAAAAQLGAEEPERARTMLMTLAPRLSAQALVEMIFSLPRLTADDARELLDAASSLAPAAKDLIMRSFEEVQRRDQLGAGRGLMQSPVGRYFLAALRCASDRNALMDLLRSEHPHRNPAEVAIEGIEAMRAFDWITMDDASAGVTAKLLTVPLHALEHFAQEQDEFDPEDVQEFLTHLRGTILRPLFVGCDS